MPLGGAGTNNNRSLCEAFIKYQPCARYFTGFESSFTATRVLGIISSAFYREGSSGIERVAGHHEAADRWGQALTSDGLTTDPPTFSPSAMPRLGSACLQLWRRSATDNEYGSQRLNIVDSTVGRTARGG